MGGASYAFIGVALGAALLCNGQVHALTSQKPTTPDAAAATGDQVAWLIFVDDLHLDFIWTGFLRNVVRTIATRLGEGDALVGFGSSGPSTVSLAPTSDRVSRNAALSKITGNGLRPDDFLTGTAPGAARETRYRAHTSLSALYSAVTSLSSVPATRKHIIYISNGFAIVQRAASATPAPSGGNSPVQFVDDAEIRKELARVAQISVEGGVTISALDPRPYFPKNLDPLPMDVDLWQRIVNASHKTLRDLTTPTGGALFDGAQSLNEVLVKLRAGH